MKGGDFISFREENTHATHLLSQKRSSLSQRNHDACSCRYQDVDEQVEGAQVGACVCAWVAACCSLCSAKFECQWTESMFVCLCVYGMCWFCVFTRTQVEELKLVSNFTDREVARLIQIFNDLDLDQVLIFLALLLRLLALLAVEARGTRKRAVLAQIDLSTVFQKTSYPLHKNNLIYQRPCRGAGE